MESRLLFSAVLSSILVLQVAGLGYTLDPVLGQSDHRFYISATPSEVTPGWRVKIEGTLCPTPTPAGTDYKTFYNVVRPDGSLINGFSSERYYCDSKTLLYDFRPDAEGTWRFYAVVLWFDGYTEQEVRSNPVYFTVSSG